MRPPIPVVPSVLCLASLLGACDGDPPLDVPVELPIDRPDRAPEPYPISASIDPGPTSTGLYETVTPFEHADVERTHVYRADFGGSLFAPERNTIALRAFDGVHETPYNVVTRDRNELFLSGGTQGDIDAAEGPYVTKFDVERGAVLWRTDLRETKALGEFLWPGLVTAHGNGGIYAIYGVRIARLDPEDGRVLAELELPTPEGFEPEDITYNGFTVLRSGVIVTKSYGRPAGCEEQGIEALLCATPENPIPPSIVVAVDPNTLQVLSTYQLSEGSGGRITSGRFGEREYIYVPGVENIVRFELTGEGLELDPDWRVEDYLVEGQTPASAPVLMGPWVVFQTNYSISTSPLSVYAVSQADASVRLRTEPFSDLRAGISAIPSALTADPDNLRIYAMDAGRGQIGCLELVDGERLEVQWVVDQTTMNHTSLVGPPEARVFVSTDAPDLLPALAGRVPEFTEQVVWRSAETGEELARTEPLAPMLPGDPLAPGFDGVWYYPGLSGELLEVKVEVSTP